MGDGADNTLMLKTASAFPSIRHKFGDFDHWRKFTAYCHRGTVDDDRR
jgi:hypothetical protein